MTLCVFFVLSLSDFICSVIPCYGYNSSIVDQLDRQCRRSPFWRCWYEMIVTILKNCRRSFIIWSGQKIVVVFMSVSYIFIHSWQRLPDDVISSWISKGNYYRVNISHQEERRNEMTRPISVTGKLDYLFSSPDRLDTSTQTFSWSVSWWEQMIHVIMIYFLSTRFRRISFCQKSTCPNQFNWIPLIKRSKKSLYLTIFCVVQKDQCNSSL